MQTTHWAGTNATGLKGFLVWLRQFQPLIYRHTVAVLAAKYPQDFASGSSALGSLGDLGQSSSSMLQPISVNLSTSLPSLSSIDAATSTATTSAPSSGLVGDISSLIGSLSSAYLGYSQAQQSNSIVQAQLQRAQEGLAPLTITNGSSGIPQISTGLPSWVWIAGGLAAAGAVLFLVSKRRGRG